MLEPLEVEIRTLHAILGSEQDPDGRAFAPLADAYRRSGQPRKAFGLLTDGLARLPDFASGHVVAARLYAEQGLFEEGALAARRALELDSENVSALAVLVRVLDAKGHTDEAGEAFATLEALEPDILVEEAVARPEPVMEVSDLAPDGDPDGVESMAPDAEPIMDIGALAPEEDDEVLDVASLAPEEDEEVLDVASLTPEEESPIDVASLAPESEEPPIGVTALAPEPEEPTIDIGALAPEPEDEVLDVASLAPEDEPAIDVASLALEEEPAIDVGALAPEEPTIDMGASAPEPQDEALRVASSAPGPSDDPPEPRKSSAPRIYTRTLGELYAKQGFVDRAVEVFRQLEREHPQDEGIAERRRELEAQLDGSDMSNAEAGAEHAERARARDEELEALARDLAEHREREPEIDTPFAWTDSEEADAGDAGSDQGSDTRIGDYFQDLLSYRPRGGGA